MLQFQELWRKSSKAYKVKFYIHPFQGNAVMVLNSALFCIKFGMFFEKNLQKQLNYTYT